MIKLLLWLGVALTALGAIVLLVFVVPHVGSAFATATAPNGQSMPAGPSSLAVGVAGFGLAAGLALVGIGFGKWKRPNASATDGHPEV